MRPDVVFCPTCGRTFEPRHNGTRLTQHCSRSCSRATAAREVDEWLGDLIERAKRGEVAAEYPWPVDIPANSPVADDYVFLTASTTPAPVLRSALRLTPPNPSADPEKQIEWERRIEELHSRPAKRRRRPKQNPLIAGAIAWCDLLIEQVQRHIESLAAA